MIGVCVLHDDPDWYGTAPIEGTSRREERNMGCLLCSGNILKALPHNVQ